MHTVVTQMLFTRMCRSPMHMDFLGVKEEIAWQWTYLRRRRLQCGRLYRETLQGSCQVTNAAYAAICRSLQCERSSLQQVVPNNCSDAFVQFARRHFQAVSLCTHQWRNRLGFDNGVPLVTFLE